MVDFFKKMVNFEFSSKWENVLLLIVKIIVLKQVIQNADVIVTYLYAGFNSIGDTVTSLPNGVTFFTDEVTYGIERSEFGKFMSFVNPFDSSVSLKSFFNVYDDDSLYTGHYRLYSFSPTAVQMYYPNFVPPVAEIVDGVHILEVNKIDQLVPMKNFDATWESVKLFPFQLALKFIAMIIFVVVFARLGELAVYTIFAPLPLACFASETSSDVAKSFIKNYIAVVLQIAVIGVVFLVYGGTLNVINYSLALSGISHIHYLAIVTLGLGVVKSGAISRKLCGMG